MRNLLWIAPMASVLLGHGHLGAGLAVVHHLVNFLR